MESESTFVLSDILIEDVAPNPLHRMDRRYRDVLIICDSMYANLITRRNPRA